MRIAGLGLQFISSVIIARLLGVDGFGIYSFAFTCVIMAAMMVSLGFDQLAVREVPRFLRRNQPDLLRGFLLLTFLVILGMSIVGVFISIWMSANGWLDVLIGWPWLVAAMMIHALILNLATVMNGLHRILQSQFVETILRPGIFLLVLGLLLLLDWPLVARDVFAISVMVSVPILVLMIWLVWRAVRAETAIFTDMPQVRLEARLWMVSAIPLLVMSFANQMQTNLDVLVLGVLADAADVGRYRAASRGADLMLIANGISLQILGPMLSRTLAGVNPSTEQVEAQRLITQSAQVSFILGGGIFIILFISAGVYLNIFGESFVPAAPVLRILLAAQMISILTGPVAIVLITTGHERLVMIISLGSLALNLALNLTLIPAFGTLGAAWATLSAIVILKLIMLAIVLRHCCFNPTLWSPLNRLLPRVETH